MLACGVTLVGQMFYHPYLSQQMAICWPFLPHCQSIPYGDSSRVLVGAALIAGSLLSIPLFLRPEKTRQALIALAAVSLVKWALIWADYGYMGNYYYVTLVLTFVFLFVPNKKELIQLFVVGVYVSSSFLKYNTEWLSGAALLHPFDFLPRFGLLPLYATAAIEGVVSWLLLSGDRRLKSFALFVMVAFHVSSVRQVGFFFPVTMLMLLSIFLFTQWDPDPIPVLDRVFSRGLKRSSVIVMSLFVFAQLVPRIMTVDPAMTGLFRIPALTMLDARLQCRGSALVKTENGYEHFTDFVLLKTVRSSCDPEHYLEKIRRLCESSKAPVHFTLRSIRTTGTQWVQILEMPDACEAKYPLSWAELFQRQEVVQ